MDEVAVGLVGLGTVGGGAARILLDNADVIAERIGTRIRLKRAVDLDLSLAEKVGVPPEIASNDIESILGDPEIGAVVQVIGGLTAAREIMKRILSAGKSVITANKALLATHGRELFETAREHGQSIAFEASVGGGIPIISALHHGLAANRIESISAIANGTANFVLSQMSEAGHDYDKAVRRAQELGYAEADPTMDVDGTDSAHKLVILAALAFGAETPLDQVRKQGITQISQGDVHYAAELGYAIKLLATGRCDDQTVELEVSPRLVHKSQPLAQVSGAFNAVSVVGDAVGPTMFYGQGAGRMPTGSAIVADVIDTVTGTAKIDFDGRGLWSGKAKPLRLTTPAEIASRFYLRFIVKDRPNVLAGIAGVLGSHNISLANVIQHPPDGCNGAGDVPLVIMTHQAVQADMMAAMAEIEDLPTVTDTSVCLRVEE
jgi:homoserine dehydrogenase